MSEKGYDICYFKAAAFTMKRNWSQFCLLYIFCDFIR